MHNCRCFVGQKSQKLQKEGFLTPFHRDESSNAEYLVALKLPKSQTSLEMGDFDLHIEHHSGYHFKIY